MQFVQANRYNLNVEKVGSGFPLMFLHDRLGLDHSTFRPSLVSLCDLPLLLYVEERVLSRLERVGLPEVFSYVANMGYGAFDYRPRLKDVDKPILVIVGEYDRTTTTRAARVLHEGIPNSELHIVPGAGHMSFVEQPDDYLSTVRNFLASSA